MNTLKKIVWEVSGQYWLTQSYISFCLQKKHTPTGEPWAYLPHSTPCVAREIQRQVRKSFSQSTSTLFGETNTYKNNYSLWERQVQRTMIAGGGEVTTKRVAGGWKLHEYVKFQPGLQKSQELAWWWKEGKGFVHTSRRVYTSPCLQGSLGIQAGAVCPTTCLLTMSKLQLA